jgi:hypothetical protein
MPNFDGATMLRALAEEDALRVFAAVVAATGTGLPHRSGTTISVRHTTVAGIIRGTGMPISALRGALAQLTDAQLIVKGPNGAGWRTNLSALREVAAALPA